MYHDESSSFVQLRFVKGSHKWGWFHPRKFATEQNYAVVSSTEGQLQVVAIISICHANNQLFCGRLKFNGTEDDLRKNSALAFNFQAINIINSCIDHGFSKSMFL
jgi:hypothetical protein